MVKTPIDYVAQISAEEVTRIRIAALITYNPERLKGIFDSSQRLADAAMESEMRRRYDTRMYGPAGSTLISLITDAMQKKDEQARESDLAIINVLEEANLP